MQQRRITELLIQRRMLVRRAVNKLLDAKVGRFGDFRTTVAATAMAEQATARVKGNKFTRVPMPDPIWY